MIKTEQIVLTPQNLVELYIKTGISQAELDLQYMEARENGELVVFTITITVESTRRKTMDKLVICRECRDGKCVNCDGSALNVEIDDIVECECKHG